MAFKDRLKKTFRKKSASSGEATQSKISTQLEYSYTGRKDVEYYKPHEIPKSKYRGKVDPQHKERLESFCFNDAFSSSPRRKSSDALSGFMSPGGTKSQSRRASYVSQASRSARNSVSKIAGFGSKSTSNGQHSSSSLSTSTSLTSEGSEGGPPSFETGLSRQETLKSDSNLPPEQLKHEATITQPISKHTEPVCPPSEQPFTADELERAMTRVTIRTDHTGGFRNSLVIAAH